MLNKRIFMDRYNASTATEFQPDALASDDNTDLKYPLPKGGSD